MLMPVWNDLYKSFVPQKSRSETTSFKLIKKLTLTKIMDLGRYGMGISMLIDRFAKTSGEIHLHPTPRVVLGVDAHPSQL